MSKQLITDDVLQSAFDWLVESSDNIASARANVVSKTHDAKAMHAKLFLNAPGSSVEARKAWATAHDDYGKAMAEVAIAEGTWALVQDQRAKAETIIEAWRTEQASRRIIDRIR